MLENKKILVINMIVSMMVVLSIIMTSSIAAENTTTTNTTKEIKISYNTHIQDIGWEKDFSKSNGQMSGTQGKSKRLEAIKIKGENLPSGAKIQYQVHVQNIRMARLETRWTNSRNIWKKFKIRRY